MPAPRAHPSLDSGTSTGLNIALYPKGFRNVRRVIVRRLDIQDDAQRGINAAQLVEAEEPDALAEPARVDRCGLLGKYPGVHGADFDLGPKARGTS